jgi:hypothetical protein
MFQLRGGLSSEVTFMRIASIQYLFVGQAEDYPLAAETLVYQSAVHSVLDVDGEANYSLTG